MEGVAFELVGGRLCLDFVNTVSNYFGSPRNDKLESYDLLVAWARQAGAIPDGDARKLGREAARRPERAARVLREAIELRELLFRAFHHLAHGEAIPDKEVGSLNRWVAGALSRQRLVRAGRAYTLDWERDDEDLDAPLWPVTRSAVDLLTSPDRDRVRACAGNETCTWLFLDESRNQSRRWCSMRDCGNRAKARRFYRKMTST